MKKEIEIACPASRGAAYPAFDPMKVNESKFEDWCRFKEADIRLDVERKEGHVEWLSQEADDPTKKFNDEILRAFKENGAPAGTVIYVEFGSRDTGLEHSYDLQI